MHKIDDKNLDLGTGKYYLQCTIEERISVKRRKLLNESIGLVRWSYEEEQSEIVKPEKTNLVLSTFIYLSDARHILT